MQPWLLIPFVSAVVSRLAAQLALGLESWEYDEIARNVLSGRGYVFDHLGTTYHAFATPAYPSLLVAVEFLSGGSAALIGPLQALLGGALALTCASLGQRLTGARAGLVAGVGVALHPGLVVYATKIHALNLDALLLALAVLVLCAWLDRPRRALDVALGALGGVVVLARPTYMAFIVLVATVGLLSARASRRIAGACIIAGLAAVMAMPWVVRNELVLGRPILSSSIGEGLWRGNNSVASGGSLTDDGVAIIDAAPDVRDLVWGKPELQQDDLFFALASRYMAADPGRTASGFARKLAAFWWFTPRSGALYPSPWLTAYAVVYSALVVAALVGAGILWSRGRRAALLVLVAATVTISALQSVFYVEGRHRWEVESLLVVLAAVAADAGLGVFARPHARTDRTGT